MIFLGTLNKSLNICLTDADGDPIAGQGGCYNLQASFDWIKRCIVSIFLVFFIAFLPLFLQGKTRLLHALRVTETYQIFQNLLNVEPVQH